MVNKTIAIYSIIDDILKAIQYYEDKRRIMTSAEVITTAIVSSLLFSGNMQKAWIHSVTFEGFLLKVKLFIFAWTLDKAFL